MNEHVLDDLADYIEGRLSPERARAVDVHLATCTECAEDFTWAREFRDVAAAQGYRHLSPARIVELSDLRDAGLSDAERRHLDRCDRCRDELAWARGLPPMPKEDPWIVRGTPRAKRFWGLASVTALAATVWLLLIPRDKPDVARFAVIEPLPVRLSRGEADSGLFHETRLRGLELYAAADYAAAREAFQHAADLQPDDAEVNLYLGSAELLIGQESRAIPRLRHAAMVSTSPLLKEEAVWQLASAHLAAGDRGEAVAALREVISLDRRHRDEAERILGEVEGWK